MTSPVSVHTSINETLETTWDASLPKGTDILSSDSSNLMTRTRERDLLTLHVSGVPSSRDQT